MDIKKEVLINRSIEDVWEILGNQYPDAYKWARGLDYSIGSGTPKFEGLSVSDRTCDVPGFGTITEEVKQFDPANHILSYEVLRGFPGFITTAVNTWKLTSVGKATKVDMHLHMETKGLMGALMGPMMKMKLNTTINGVVQDLKAYIETGKPSAVKQKELIKFQQKSAKTAA